MQPDQEPLTEAEQREYRELYGWLTLLRPDLSWDAPEAAFRDPYARGKLKLLRGELAAAETALEAPDHSDPDLKALREDASAVKNAGVHPDRLYTDSPEDIKNTALQEWAARRPQVEEQLDQLAQNAAHWQRHLTATELAKIEALRELREAEAEVRDRDGPDSE